MDFEKNLLVSASPHLHYGETTKIIMQDVIIALIPAAVISVVYFGLRALLLIALCVGTSVLSEFICRKVMKRRQTIGDYSAVVTGLLLAFSLPPMLNPVYAVIGSAIAIVVVKQMFGGIGMNFANPAVTARIVLFLSFAADMCAFSRPFYWMNSGIESIDAVSGATPLAESSMPTSLLELFVGYHAGCLGETCAIALILGGCFLLLRRIITWEIPVCFIGTVFVLSWIFGQDPLYAILSGGVMLGAIFMATDYTTSPITKKGQVIFGIGCGLFTVFIRYFGSYNEGVCYSIMVMNCFTALIDKYTKPTRFGVVKSDKKEAAAK
ncbi:MAG: RnfABCDGE type electron transport complex subunit D [Clostridia bacterium]|nr:RnfABCDGE type electron transport complex subunit D [Clostridia bacterium]